MGLMFEFVQTYKSYNILLIYLFCFLYAHIFHVFYCFLAVFMHTVISSLHFVEYCTSLVHVMYTHCLSNNIQSTRMFISGSSRLTPSDALSAYHISVHYTS
jgi:hypothetical protein